MFHKGPLRSNKNACRSWNDWILICAITVLIAVITVIELHIRGLITHSVLPR